MVRWKMLTRRNLWLMAGLALLGLCGCGGPCPRDSVYREPATWLATHALASETVALPESAAACFGDSAAIQVPPQADAVDLLSLLDDRRPDYLVAGNDVVWESIRDCQQKNKQLSSFEKIGPRHLEIHTDEFVKTSTGKVKREHYSNLEHLEAKHVPIAEYSPTRTRPEDQRDAAGTRPADDRPQ